MRASRGTEGDYGTNPSQVEHAFVYVGNAHGYQIVSDVVGPDYDKYKDEIDVDRPTKIGFTHYGGAPDGGHAVCGTGYDYTDVNNRALIVHNTWSADPNRGKDRTGSRLPKIVDSVI